MSARAETLPKSLVAGVLVMTLLVIGLGGAVVALKLRPQPLPTDSVNREIALWQDAVAATPNDADAHTGLGMAELSADDPDRAQAEFEKALSLDHTSWMAAFQLSQLVKASDPQRAIDLLGQAVRFSTGQDRSAPLIALGDLQLTTGDDRSAAETYRKSIAIDPFTFDGHYGLARALEGLGQKKDALGEYQQAKRFDPTNPDVADAIARLTNG